MRPPLTSRAVACAMDTPPPDDQSCGFGVLLASAVSGLTLSFSQRLTIQA